MAAASGLAAILRDASLRDAPQDDVCGRRPPMPHILKPVPFSLAFVFGCDLFQTESEIAKVNGRSPRSASWTEFSTSRLSGAASMAAASRAMRWVAEILFSSVK